ncbi:MAG: SGNH/GDSL hydrolase family protein [Candidatus Kapabacteria bacterium]|nr:SGNH/GDSL hydrolase family protein [Candidatus Kapabacteria bacterium]
MKNITKIHYSILSILMIVAIGFLASCNPSIVNPIGTGNLGSLSMMSKDSTVYVSMGNSLVAGYQSGGVTPTSQKYSYPNIIAQQMGIQFHQPTITEPGLGSLINNFQGFDATGNPIIGGFPGNGTVSDAQTYLKPYNNLGVPGAIMYDLIDTSAYANRHNNPFYSAVLRASAFGKCMVDQAIALKPDFITIEIGDNDVLGYATSGGTSSTAVDAGGKPIPTPAAQLFALYAGALTKLTTALPNTKIIIITIPDVTGIPYFTTFPWNALLLDQSTADQLNAAYKALGFSFKPGPNGFVAASPSAPGGMKQLTANDRILLPLKMITDSLSKAGWGTMKPIPNQYILDAAEVAIVKQAVTDYNDRIKGLTSISKNGNIKVFDMDALFKQIQTTGYPVPGSTTMTASYISGELFSLDGVHPSSRGYGAIANELIKFINTNYGADIPLKELTAIPSLGITK